MDLHAGQIQGFFTIPVDHMTAQQLFARHFRDLGHFGCVDRTILHRAPVSMQIDPLLSMAAEGRRDVVRRVWRYIKLDPNTHPMMQQKDDYE